MATVALLHAVQELGGIRPAARRLRVHRNLVARWTRGEGFPGRELAERLGKLTRRVPEGFRP